MFELGNNTFLKYEIQEIILQPSSGIEQYDC